jgi:hypothetical protein
MGRGRPYMTREMYLSYDHLCADNKLNGSSKLRRKWTKNVLHDTLQTWGRSRTTA